MNRGQGGGDGSSKQRQGWLRAYEKTKIGRALFFFACVPLVPLFMPMTRSSLMLESGVIASPMSMRTSSPRLVVGIARPDCCQVLEAGG